MVAVVIVFALTLGGIQFGVFTPTEAASVATVFVFLFHPEKLGSNNQGVLLFVSGHWVWDRNYAD
jgi:TRAP-type mannitol/chloroaromatic compound transport system permease large subunit